MTIEQTAHTITNWINSCETAEQLDLCKEAIERFIKDRFKGEVTDEVMDNSVDELKDAIADRTAFICTYLKPAGVEVTRNNMKRTFIFAAGPSF